MATYHDLHIRKFSWWRASDKRIFIIVELLWEPGEEPHSFKNNTVGLMDLFADEVIYRPWEEFCQLVDDKLMNKITPETKEKYIKDKIVL